MARNPLETDPAREQRVRECAYHLWEADGKPHGRDIEYWERARELISRQDTAKADAAAPRPPAPETESRAKVEAKPKAEAGAREASDRRKKGQEVEPPRKAREKTEQPEVEAAASRKRTAPGRKKK
jgi:hypothetical protein